MQEPNYRCQNPKVLLPTQANSWGREPHSSFHVLLDTLNFVFFPVWQHGFRKSWEIFPERYDQKLSYLGLVLQSL